MKQATLLSLLDGRSSGANFEIAEDGEDFRLRIHTAQGTAECHLSRSSATYVALKLDLHLRTKKPVESITVSEMDVLGIDHLLP